MHPPAAVQNSTLLLSHVPTEALASINLHQPFLEIDPPPCSETVPSHLKFESYFRIPAYETVVPNEYVEDSIRLPSYSDRSLCRFRPYWPYTSPFMTKTDTY